ncbi:disintegrin and metalloproteinase domain-containing protein 11-like isoform X4 [Branchiostoma floridae]|uniref:Disintegrin and metalloproteinase domain-containing protein 11-like isoform X4 n=1 Tax=Branchiostoma floridae TaxID=7739 RepID=A0A9J7N2Z8_BRAFL|nr:disintegrin and metalloproteinase domain-containing protein 11-like isoform X4 [Branchiostoma floridae]
MVSGVSAELGLLIFTVAHCCLGGHIPSKTDHSSGPSEQRQYRIKRENQTDSTVPLRLRTYNSTEPAEHLSTRLKDQYRNDRLLHTSHTSFLVPAFGRQFVLDLELNHGLLSSRYVERYYTNQSSKPVVVKGTEHCYYHGRIRGRPGSTVALSTCNGLLGMFDDGDSLYFIRPSDDQDVVPEKNGQLHIVYRTNVKTMQQDDVLVRDEPQKDTKSSRLDRLRELLFRRKPKARLKRDVLPETKYIELILVNDNRMFQMYKNNSQRTSSVAKTVANLVDAMYSKQLNTRIALVAIETWDSEDQIAVNSDAQETLRQFLKYRYRNLLNWQSHDAAHLLSGMAFADGVTGQAPINGICTKRNSGGVNENQNPRNAVVLAVTLAHQLGHNLGMHDDNGRDCFKACPDWYGCIMEKERGIQQPRRFSQCSVRDYRQLLMNGLGACIFNRPQKLHEPPYCGNGFIEKGEQCDCGPPTPANAKYYRRCVKCCDNCMLTEEAQCAHGECCDLSTCKYKEGDTACRAPVNACDLEEKCTGRSGECPDNLYKQDGQLCEVDGHCYYGECRTRTNQCKYVWGEDVYTADDVCYQRLNINGNRDGNCGKSEDGGWDKCEPKDIFCGYLLCDGNVTVPRVGVLDGSLTSKSYPRTGKTMHCKGGHVLLDDSNNIGYVQDGTTCGTNKMCHSGRCVEVSSFNITPCPVGVNGLPCSGHGNCTNEDRCLCDTKEWRGRDCGNYVPPANNGDGMLGNQGRSFTANRILGAVMTSVLVYACCFGAYGLGNKSAVRRGKRSGKSTPKTSPTEEKDTQGDGKTADGKGGGNTTSPNSPAPCSDGDVCVGSEGHMTVTVAMPRDETSKSTPQANGVIHTSDDDHTSGEINPILYLNGHAPHVQANGHTQRNGYAQADGHAHLHAEGDANSDTQPSKSKRSRRSGRKKHTNKDADGPTEQDKSKQSQRRPHHDHEHENKVRRGPPPPPSHETHVNAAEHNATGHSPHSTRKGDKRNFVAKWIEDVNYNKHDGPPPPRFVRSDSPKHKVKMSASPEPIRRPQTLKLWETSI